MQWQVREDELHHLVKVVRLGVGAPVEVFDGLGRVAAGKITQIGKKEALVAAEREHFFEPVLAPVTLCVGALRPQNIDDVIAGLCEVGVDRLWVFAQDTGEKYRSSPQAEARWRRLGLAATKQCKRPRLMEITQFANLPNLLKAVNSDVVGRWYCHESAALSPGLDELNSYPATVIVGSEGGLSPTETAALDSHGFRALKLGNNILRASTAAVLAAGLIVALRDTCQKGVKKSRNSNKLL
jgi:16S rRNA (uracil1498-N3)-methyltransferase